MRETDRPKCSIGGDPRITIAFVILAMLIILSSTTWKPMVFIVLCSLVFFLFSGISLYQLSIRLLPPMTMALVLVLIFFITVNEGQPLSINLGLFLLKGYYGGLLKGGILVTRVFAGVLLLLFLSYCYNISQLASALKWYRVPQPILEILQLSYRYIFLFKEEALRMQKAQKIRLGYGSWLSAIQSAGSLGAMLTIRAYDRGERIFRSMQSRGYQDGTSLFALTSNPEPMYGIQWSIVYLILLIFLLLCAFL